MDSNARLASSTAPGELPQYSASLRELRTFLNRSFDTRNRPRISLPNRREQSFYDQADQVCLLSVSRDSDDTQTS